MEIVNSYKYLGYTLTTKLSSNSACEEYASKAKGKILDLMKTMWSLGSLNTTVFFQLFDAQIKPMLLYASEIWGTSKLRITESAHLFACKRLLSLSDKSPNHMVYGKNGKIPIVHRQQNRLPQILVETWQNAHYKIPKTSSDYAPKQSRYGK